MRDFCYLNIWVTVQTAQAAGKSGILQWQTNLTHETCESKHSIEFQGNRLMENNGQIFKIVRMEHDIVYLRHPADSVTK